MRREFRANLVPRPLHIQAFSLPPIFSNETPVDLEIGCGVGFHPIQYALKNPGRYLIAIEHTKEKFKRFESRLSRHDRIENLLPVHANAVSWVTHALQPKSLSRVFFFYPNPSKKNPAARWLQMPFFSELLLKLKPEAEIILATNERWYFDEACEKATSRWHLTLRHQSAFSQTTNPDFEPRTHFEKKYLERGESCYEAIFRHAVSGIRHTSSDAPQLGK